MTHPKNTSSILPVSGPFWWMLVAAVSFVGSACAPIYMPVSPNTPMLKERGEVKAELNASTSGLEIKGAYALTDNQVIAGMLSAGAGDADDDFTDRSIHRYGEVAYGYIVRPAPYFLAESFGGIGLGFGRGEGRLTIGESTSKIIAEGTYFKPFLQNNLAIQTGILDFGLVNRLSLIQFRSIDWVGTDKETITSPSSPLFWEPSVFLQVGSDRFKLASHLGLSTPIAGSPDFHWLFLHMGLGINYRFSGSPR